MTDFQEIMTGFLTVDEAAEVDKALMTSRDRFLTRIALYSLRSLKKIAQESDQSIEETSPQQVLAWVEQDESISIEVEDKESFQMFFTQLVMSSLKPLQRIAADEESGAIANLTTAQVINWFEKDTKLRLEQGDKPGS
ncbi:MAG: hypothetical protein KME11_17085 [Timaviella obliquedivisa GSE-PSE-MK23-08B]|jgi:hypothetical protein|nr:hypothetical protein [Timaviella obliquedivisa GSE-PSE-MK23-08B]